MTAAPFCNVCGARFEGDDRFCANCGAGRPMTRPIQQAPVEEASLSEERPYASRWEANQRSTNPRPYASIAPYQQPAVMVDDGPGWLIAVLVSAAFTVLVVVYLNNLQGEVIISGQFIGTMVSTGPTTTEIVGSAAGAFVGLVITLRGFFALLNIERSLRSHQRSPPDARTSDCPLAERCFSGATI